MKTMKALVIEHDEKARQVIDEVLLAVGHRYEVATSLSEARELLTTNGYAYVLLNCVIPARPGGTARRQNAENFLDDLRKIKGDSAPPVIIMFDPMPEIDEEIKVSWSCDLTLRGARRFIQKPFRTEGRTLDRVIKKTLAGQAEQVKLVAIPVVAITGSGAPMDTCNVTPLDPLPAQPKHLDSPARQQAEPVPLPATKTGDGWGSISNEPIELDDFMAEFCDERSKENRVCRKRAILAAARHKTVKLPALTGPRKHGQSNKYLTHDLFAAWQGFLDEGVDLPPLLPQYRPTKPGSAA